MRTCPHFLRLYLRRINPGRGKRGKNPYIFPPFPQPEGIATVESVEKDRGLFHPSHSMAAANCGKRGKGPWTFPPFPQQPKRNGASLCRHHFSSVAVAGIPSPQVTACHKSYLPSLVPAAGHRRTTPCPKAREKQLTYCPWCGFGLGPCGTALSTPVSPPTHWLPYLRPFSAAYRQSNHEKSHLCCHRGVSSFEQ